MQARLSARTVLEAFLPARGEVPLGPVYDAANQAGVGDQTLRLAIRRMVAAGDVTQSGRGRSGALALTEQGRDAFRRDRAGLALAAAQDTGELAWDGRWRLVALSVPERDRRVRDTARRDLLDVGAVAVSTGLYVSPHDLDDVLPAATRAHLTTATATDLDVRGTRDPRAITEMLWPAAPVLEVYEATRQALAADRDDGSTPVLVRRLLLADALERSMRHDPLVPPELRAGPWPPSALRLAWAERWEQLSARDDYRLYDGW
ncbi:PaaX family transcriptional regulator [Thalassiella azotivora]